MKTSISVCTRLLCLALLLPLVIFPAACGQAEETASPGSDSSSVASAVSEESYVLFSNLPERNFGGADFTFLVEGDYMTTYASVEICPQESSYQRLNDAITDRNNMITERFGVELKEIRTENAGDMLTRLRNNAVSGVSEYDIVMPYMGAAATLAMEGVFLDLGSLPNIHLTEAYYDQGAVEDLSVSGKNYFVTGDLSLLSFACTHAIVFNKDIVKDRDLENPYQLVKDGNWTLDKLAEMARQVTADTDGETGMGYTDTYGFLVNSNFTNSMYIGTGQRFTVKNENDVPTIAVSSASANSVFDKIFELVNNKQVSGQIDNTTGDFYITASGAGKNVWVAATEAVASKRVLFRAMALIDILDLGEYECSFGILPVPKLSAEQERYYSRVSTIYASCVAIPSNVKDQEMSAIILDAMMQASTDTVKNAYFQVIMKERKIQDEDSEEMLDIIFDSRVYDLASVYNWGGSSESDSASISGFMNVIAFSGTNTFVSTWQTIESKVQSAMDDTLAAYQLIGD